MSRESQGEQAFGRDSWHAGRRKEYSGLLVGQERQGEAVS